MSVFGNSVGHRSRDVVRLAETPKRRLADQEIGHTFGRLCIAFRSDGEKPAPITLPTRIRWTECDKALEIEWTDRLAEFFTDLDYKPFPDAGHFPHHEQPEHAAHEIAEFFLQLDHLGWRRSPKAR